MKRILSIFVLVTALLMGACDNQYDDSQILADLEELKDMVEQAKRWSQGSKSRWMR